MGIRHRLAHNAPYISTIGVALALVREQIERNVANPSDEDVRRIRHDVMEAITRAGADERTVDISVEIDSQRNILRATATGATELRTKDRVQRSKTDDELKAIVAEALGIPVGDVSTLCVQGRWHVLSGTLQKKSFFGLISSKREVVRVLDEDGVIRLQRNDARVLQFTRSELQGSFARFVSDMTRYSDAGETLPKTFLFFGQKMSDLSGVLNMEQLLSLAEMELEFVASDETIIAVAARD